MTRRLLLNPLTGNFDYVDIAAPAPTTGGAPPTTLLAGGIYTVNDNTQVLYTRSIVLEAGASIVIGTNAVLEHVT